jgi:hypothetical protein
LLSLIFQTAWLVTMVLPSWHRLSTSSFVFSHSGCSKVTENNVPFLSNLGQSLEGLNLQFCNMIGSHNIASLEKQLWWCDILD